MLTYFLLILPKETIKQLHNYVNQIFPNNYYRAQVALNSLIKRCPMAAKLTSFLLTGMRRERQYTQRAQQISTRRWICQQLMIEKYTQLKDRRLIQQRVAMIWHLQITRIHPPRLFCDPPSQQNV